MNTSDVEAASHAARLLNMLLGDLGAARHSFEITERIRVSPNINASTSYWAVVHRAFLVHLVVTLSKLCEVYERYARIVPASTRNDFKRVYNDIHSRGVVDLRNRFCAHIWDKKYGAPLSREELDHHIELLCGGDLASLIPWFWNVDGAPNSPSIGGVVERCRDSLLQEFKLDSSVVCNI